MRSRAGLAGTSVAVLTAVAVLGGVLVPEKGASWAFVGAFPPLLWAFLEAASPGTSEAAVAIREHHRTMIAVLCLLIALAVLPDLVIVRGGLDPEWHLIARRARGLIVGAVMAFWGNHLPKIMSPWSLVSEPFDWQGVHRFVGMVFTLAGVALVLVWATMPLVQANGAAMAITVIAMAVAIARKLISVLWYSVRGGPALR